MTTDVRKQDNFGPTSLRTMESPTVRRGEGAACTLVSLIFATFSKHTSGCMCGWVGAVIHEFYCMLEQDARARC